MRRGNQECEGEVKLKPIEMWAIISKETGKILKGCVVTHLYETQDRAILLNSNEDDVVPILITERFPKEEKVMNKIKLAPPEGDPVNHPAYYQGANGIESIDVIEGFGLNYHLGQVIKYVLRCGKKGHRLQDLKKAEFYLRREIKNSEETE